MDLFESVGEVARYLYGPTATVEEWVEGGVCVAAVAAEGREIHRVTAPADDRRGTAGPAPLLRDLLSRLLADLERPGAGRRRR